MNRIALFQDFISQAQTWFFFRATYQPAAEDAGERSHVRITPIFESVAGETALENVREDGDLDIWAGAVRHGGT